MQKTESTAVRMRKKNMKVVLQRVTHAQVTVEEQVVGKIGHGFLLLLGVEDADTVETCLLYTSRCV